MPSRLFRDFVPVFCLPDDDGGGGGAAAAGKESF